ncbi:hypothetical protein [Rathayibacter tritici]|uniref:hypothetical protein n=1 Tax=Rathayibacter tritici TaxID=33888 RepID=UPI000A9A1400|nr:hypothetical protein [Rathayibacter tritici]
MPLTEQHIETGRILDDAFADGLTYYRLDESHSSYVPWYSRCLSAFALTLGSNPITYAGVGHTTEEPDHPCLVVFTRRSVHLIETSAAVEGKTATVVTAPIDSLVTHSLTVTAGITAERRAARSWPGELVASFKFDGLPEFTINDPGSNPYDLTEPPKIMKFIQAL